MTWLTFVLHLFIGSTLAGVAIVGLLVAGFTTSSAFVGAVVGGYMLAIPASVRIARLMQGK